MGSDFSINSEDSLILIFVKLIFSGILSLNVFINSVLFSASEDRTTI